MLSPGNCSSVFDKIVSIFPRFFEVISSLRSWQFRFLLAQWKKRGRSAGEARRAIFFLTPAVCRILTDQKQRPIPYFVYSPKKRYFTPKIFILIATMHILWTKLLFKRLFYIQLFLSHGVFFFLIQRIIFIGSRHVTYYYYYYYFFFFIIFFFYFAHTNNYSTLHLQFITGNCYLLQKRIKKKKKDKGMGRTWEKFPSLPAKKPRKFETATGKENF